MGSQGGGQQQPLCRQSSLYSLTLDEVQTHLRDRPLTSNNLDELPKGVWSSETNQSMGMELESTARTDGSVTINKDLSKKTVNEVWINTHNLGKNAHGRQPTLGEMSLEDYLAKANVEAESDKRKQGNSVSMSGSQNCPHQDQWVQYQYQQQQAKGQQQNVMESYALNSLLDSSYPDNHMVISSPLMGALSDTQTHGRKRIAPAEEVAEKTVERRQKRMIKNRESAARSRARKQAYTNELENKVSLLEEENERLKTQTELEKILHCGPPPEPKYQLRRSSSSSF